MLCAWQDGLKRNMRTAADKRQKPVGKNEVWCISEVWKVLKIPSSVTIMKVAISCGCEGACTGLLIYCYSLNACTYIHV